jgi:hypothetical protein
LIKELKEPEYFRVANEDVLSGKACLRLGFKSSLPEADIAKFIVPSKYERYASDIAALTAQGNYISEIRKRKEDADRKKAEKSQLEKKKAEQKEEEEYKKFVAVNPDCQVFIRDWEWAMINGRYRAYGVITNNTTEALKSVMIVVTFCSRENIKIDKIIMTTAYNTVLPDQASFFQGGLAGANPATKYATVEVFDSFGQPLRLCSFKGNQQTELKIK